MNSVAAAELKTPELKQVLASAQRRQTGLFQKRLIVAAQDKEQPGLLHRARLHLSDKRGEFALPLGARENEKLFELVQNDEQLVRSPLCRLLDHFTERLLFGGFAPAVVGSFCRASRIAPSGSCHARASTTVQPSSRSFGNREAFRSELLPEPESPVK